ncbi:MAG: caspase family protein [Sediminibacterium sp.]|nr:caspase family protein [Sediminibacterium sp.]
MNQPLYIPPTCKAVLIGSPGRGEYRLHGVENDIENYYQFLLSPRGGVFYEHEIIILADPTMDEVLDAIHSNYADYQFVYYSGHGSQDMDGNDFICLDGHDLRDDYLFNAQGPRQFLSLDSCRKYYHTISGFP